MQPPFYHVEICDINGKTVDFIDRPISVSVARALNTVGSATITFMPDHDPAIFQYNTRFKIWRTGPDYRRKLLGNTVWFLRKFIHHVSERHYEVECVDTLGILASRLVAYTAQTPYADKTLEERGDIVYADNYRIDRLMRDYMRENFGSLALDSERQNPAIVVADSPELLAPYGEKQAAWAQLDAVLADLAKMSATDGMELFYDLVPYSDASFIFKVRREFLNMDRGFHSAHSVVFSDDSDDLDEITLTLDYSNVGTVCYALGFDSGPSQVIEEVKSDDLIESDIFGRVEFVVNATDTDVRSVLRGVGRSALAGKRPKRSLSAMLSALSAVRFESDFEYGDRVGVRVQDRQFESMIRAFNATWEEGRENLEIRLDGSEDSAHWEEATPVPVPTLALPSYAPVVSAGADQTGSTDSAVALDGTVTDDGPFTVQWTKISGPGTVTFADATAVDTTATFSDGGDYVLRLTATDGTYTAYDEMAVSMVFVPPAYGDATIYHGDINAYVLYDGANVVRTWNLHATYPLWTLVSAGVTGFILDGHYVHVSEHVVGMWLMTTDGIWWCGDIMAATPVWANVLPIATVRATEVQPAAGTSGFKSMMHYASEPGYLIVATGQDSGSNDTSYLHSYTWHTHDYGATWTTVDMTEFTFTSSGLTQAYHICPLHGIAIYSTAPGTIWMIRSVHRIGTSGSAAIFKSTDLGHTWTKGITDTMPVTEHDASILAPYPGANDPTYRTWGSNYALNYPDLDISVDGWATSTRRTVPAGYDGIAYRWRPNKRTFDNTHIMAWWKKTGDSTTGLDLLESFDRGVTWNVLFNQATGALEGAYNTPNGWPPDVLKWILVKDDAGFNTSPILLTLDNFATAPVDKKGNLSSVLPGGTWNGGNNNGFALPKVGENAAVETATPLTYDNIANIVVGFAMRQMRAAYTGPLLTLRRSIDNVTQDFGFDASGFLDTTAISTFLGTASGYCTKWWEQYNGNHAVQTDAARQPLYLASGQNGKPMLKFTEDYLVSPALPVLGAGARMMFAAFTLDALTAPTFNHIMHYGSAAAQQAFGLTPKTVNEAILGNHFWSGYHKGVTVMGLGSPHIAGTTYDGTISKLWLDANQEGANSTIALNTGSAFTLRIGARISTADEFANVSMGEIAIASGYSDADNQTIRDTMNSYWQTY